MKKREDMRYVGVLLPSRDHLVRSGMVYFLKRAL